MKEKTKLSKIVALVMCLMLTLTMFSTYSFATILQTGGEETTDNKANIIVNGVEAGVKVSAYQLTTVNYDYTADQPQSTPYSWVPQIETLVQAINSNYVGTNGIDNFVKEITTGDSAENSKSFYSELAAAIRGGTVTLTAKEETATGTPTSYPVVEESLDGTVTFADCEMGTYLILIENGYMVYTPSVVNLTPEYDNESHEWELPDSVEVRVKATNPQITKTVTNDSLGEDNYSTRDEISFKIVADVPTYLPNSLAQTYAISDKLEGGLTLVEDSIVVYGKNGSAPEVELTAPGDYTLTTESATRPNASRDEADFVINFVYDEIDGFDKIIVEYKAKLSQSAETVVGGAGNTNTAYLDYSNNPYVTSSVQTQESEDTVYTYGAEVTKVDKNNPQTTLPGAEFNLMSGVDTLYFVRVSDGVYYLANSTDGGATQTLAVDTNGKLYINGLDTGTYSLVETKAPEGYNKSNTPAEIVIADTDMNGELDDGDGTGIFKVSFQNSHGFQLPVTGRMGTVAYVARGVVFIGLGITLLAVVAKKNRK